MSGRVNIPSTIQDSSYRYTMPRMVLKQESRLNGVKTNITNIVDVANALRVPSAALIKYFCAEVGANQEQDSIVKGSHTIEDLQKLLDKFITKYVLCSKCKYPEYAYEVQKKNLVARCNACGTEKTLDSLHKAGKQMIKDMPTFYSANPEFRGKQSKDKGQIEALQSESNSKKIKKVDKKQAEEEKEIAKDRANKILADGGEINALDAKQIQLDSQEIADSIAQLNTFITESDPSTEELLSEVRQTQLIMNITSEYKYYILFCGLFQGKRNVVKSWIKYEPAFLSLVKADGEVGIKRLIQTMVLYFVKFDATKQKYVNALMKTLYDQSVFSDSFVIGWHGNDIKSDKKCALYDRKSEKTFRPLLDSFVEWLQSGDYGDEYGEETAGAEQEEETKEMPAETDDQKAQRLLIESQKKAQQQAMESSKLKTEQQLEESKDNADVTDATKIDVEDNFDIDDI